MTKDEFVEMVVKNHNSKQWLSGWFEVDGKQVGIKAFGKWVQRLQYTYEVYVSTTEGTKTITAFREEVYQAFRTLDTVVEADRLKKSRMQTFDNGIRSMLNGS